MSTETDDTEMFIVLDGKVLIETRTKDGQLLTSGEIDGQTVVNLLLAKLLEALDNDEIIKQIEENHGTLPTSNTDDGSNGKV